MPHVKHRRSRSMQIALLAVLVMLAIGRLPVVAQDATPVASAVLAPDALVAGLTLGEWQARYWQWTMSTVVGQANTLLDTTGANCGLGQHGPVFFLQNAFEPGERACTVPSDVVLFVPVLVTQCSTLEPDPELPSDPALADEATLRTCARTHISVGLDQDLAATSLAIDGQDVDFADYRVSTPLFQQVILPDNMFGIEPGVASAVGDGYVVMIGPLDEGEHRLDLSWPYAPNGPVSFTYRLTVASGASTGATPTT